MLVTVMGGIGTNCAVRHGCCRCVRGYRTQTMTTNNNALANEPTRIVHLTVEQLLLLDGCPNLHKDTIRAVSAAKREHRLRSEGCPSHIAALVADVLLEAETTGHLGWRYESIPLCMVCWHDPGYATVQRSTRTKRKGAIDYDKKLHIGAVDLSAPSKIIIRNRANPGGCVACVDAALPFIRRELASSDIHAEIPAEIGGCPAKYKRHENRVCKACGWSGHSGQLVLRWDSWRHVNACPVCAKAERSGDVQWASGFVIEPASPNT